MAILTVALASILARGTFTAVSLFVAYGLLLTFAWVRLAAPDVALTEAAIGAGLSGVLLLGAARRLSATPVAPPPGLAMTLLIGLCCAAIAAALGAVILALPDPAPSLAAAVAADLPATDLGNPVTAVLMSFRALDTLLESTVVLLAVICVWALTPDGGWGGAAGAPQPVQADGPLALLARALPPLGIVVAVHILWVGADAPGGKFQAAAILAAMWLLPWMAGLAAAPRISARWLRWGLAVGSALFIAIGLAGAVLEGAFLAYPLGWAKPLILAVEFVLTGSIAVALALLVVGPSAPDRGP
ncbi:hydrogenase subunit MbhD domain-containing protein [Roseomonas sp. CAU 1739]